MIQPNFTMDAINRQLQRKAELIRNAIVRRLILLGEMCITEARDNRGYNIVTGNLTSSIGYVITDHGSVIKVAGFEKPTTASSDNTGNNDDGSKQGKALAESLAKKATSKGYALIVVAGADYALHVEAMGLNVISSAEALAERELPNMLEKLKLNIFKMK